MESPKDATKKAKLHSKLYLEVKTQAISFKTQEKTQNSRIKLKNSASHYSLVAEKMAKKQACTSCLALLRCRMDAILQHSFFDIADTKSLSRLHKKERYWNRDTCDIYYVFYSVRNQFLSHAFGGASQR